MSVRSGKETKRTPMELYKGYRVIKVTRIEYHRSLWNNSLFDKNWIDHKEVYYNFCKEGDEKYPSKDYQVGTKNVEECKEAIDKFLSGDKKDNGDIYYTHEEFQKYVKKPNDKCDYAYGYDSLMKLMRQHQKADNRMKWFLEERLHDANFHTEAGLLSEGKYDEFIELMRKDYKFKEKFEVYTETECKRIKDPKRLEAHIKSAIEEYFKAHKMDVGNTSVNVKFIEDW